MSRDSEELALDVLRATGHKEAADIVERVLRRDDPQAEAAAEQEAGGEQAAGTDPALAQGEALRDHMNKSLTPWHSAGSALSEGPER